MEYIEKVGERERERDDLDPVPTTSLGLGQGGLTKMAKLTPNSTEYWVAAKEFQLSYHTPETISCTKFK